MNKDIRDKVYINGQWVDDYFLTNEKNQELKDLRTDLNSEVRDRIEKQSVLSNKLNDEIERAKNTEKSLNQSIIETTTTLLSELNKEQKARVDADRNINTNLTTEIERAQSAENQISEALTTKINEKESSINERVDSLIANEVERAEDTYAKQENTYTKAEVDAIKDSILGEDLSQSFDTLKEIAEWISDHGKEAEELTSAITTIEAKNEEQDSQIAQNKTNIESINTEISNIKLVNTKQDNDIESLTTTVEALKAISGDTTAIDNLTATLNTKVDKELKTKVLAQIQEEKAQQIQEREDAGEILTDEDKLKIEEDLVNAAKELIINYKVLSDNNFTDELKTKLANINLSEYELLTNKSTTIENHAQDATEEQIAEKDAQDNIKYPTVKAVRDYVKENASSGPSGEIDTSNLVHLKGNSQTVEATTSFKNFSLLQNVEDNPKQISLFADEWGYVNVKASNDASGLTIGNIETNTIIGIDNSGVDITVNKITYNNDNYTIFTGDETNPTLKLVTLATVQKLIEDSANNNPGEGDNNTSTQVLRFEYGTFNDTLLNKLTEPIEGTKVVIINKTIEQNGQTLSAPVIYEYSSYSESENSEPIIGWHLSEMVLNAFSIDNLIIEEGIKAGTIIYDVKQLSETNYLAYQVYPSISGSVNLDNKVDKIVELQASTGETYTNTITSNFEQTNDEANGSIMLSSANFIDGVIDKGVVLLINYENTLGQLISKDSEGNISSVYTGAGIAGLSISGATPDDNCEMSVSVEGIRLNTSKKATYNNKQIATIPDLPAITIIDENAEETQNQTNPLKGIVHLSKANYETLKTDGSITVENVTYNYEPNTTLYITPSDSNDSSGSTPELVIDDKTSDLSISNITLDKTKLIKVIIASNKTFTVNVPTIDDTIEYYFDFKTVNVIPNVSVVNDTTQFPFPFNFEYSKYMEYLCKVMNNKVIVLGKYDAFPNQELYGTWFDSDFIGYLKFENTLTFEQKNSDGSIKSGAYDILNGIISLTYEDETTTTATYSNNTITLSGISYTK